MDMDFLEWRGNIFYLILILTGLCVRYGCVKHISKNVLKYFKSGKKKSTDKKKIRKSEQLNKISRKKKRKRKIAKKENKKNSDGESCSNDKINCFIDDEAEEAEDSEEDEKEMVETKKFEEKLKIIKGKLKNINSEVQFSQSFEKKNIKISDFIDDEAEEGEEEIEDHFTDESENKNDVDQKKDKKEFSDVDNSEDEDENNLFLMIKEKQLIVKEMEEKINCESGSKNLYNKIKFSKLTSSHFNKLNNLKKDLEELKVLLHSIRRDNKCVNDSSCILSNTKKIDSIFVGTTIASLCFIFIFLL
jgi:hypothetical protein